MARAPSILFAAAVLLGTAHHAAAQPEAFSQACLDRFGDERGALCSCLTAEATHNAAPTRDPDATLERMASMFADGAVHAQAEGQNRRARRAQESVNTWRITLQNAQLRCAAESDGLPSPFFGLRY